MHDASLRQINAFLNAIAAPVDLGVIHPARPGQDRGYGRWQGVDIDRSNIAPLLPLAARANAAGAAVYIRIRELPNHHPGVILLDDLTADAVSQLSTSGWQPCAIVQTSPGNFQAWIKLVRAGEILNRESVRWVLNRAITRFGADPRACSPVQPGRLPGFTNRKEKYKSEGRFPFVKLIAAHPNAVAEAAKELLADWTQAGRAAAAAPPETQAVPAVSFSTFGPQNFENLRQLRETCAAKIAAECRSGRRSSEFASESEIDFALARAALDAGISCDEIAHYLQIIRPQKSRAYAYRTVTAASGASSAPSTRSR